MECTVKQSDLVRELQLARGCVEKKGAIPILSHVLLEAAGNRLKISATDLEVGVTCSCGAAVKREGLICIPAQRLLDYAVLLPNGEIQLKEKENCWTSVTCGRSRARLAGMSAESFPRLVEMPDGTVDLPADVVAAMVGRVVFAISSEESRFTLNGALLAIENGVVRMVATDGHRLAFVEMESENAATREQAIIAVRGLAEIVKLCKQAGDSGRVRIAFDSNHAFFEIGGRRLAVRRIAGSFPDYGRVLPQRDFPAAELLRDEIREAVARVGQFSDEQSKAIRLQFTSGEVRLFAASSEVGDAEECVPCAYAGPDVEIGFNGHYLEQFFAAVEREKVQIGVRDSKSAGELWPAAEDLYRYRYVVMPMRV